MTLPLSISGRHDLPSLEDIDMVISIRDPEESLPSELEAYMGHVVELFFHDIEDDDFASEDDVLPEDWHLNKLAQTLQRYHPERMHVHCFYGVSRSAAVACFILAILEPEKTDADILYEIMELRPQARPNLLLLELIDAELGRDFKATWQQMNRY